MRIIIIGAVAAGTSAAAKARRNSEDCEIVIYERDSDISYSGCGLPYYIGSDVITRQQLVPRDTAYFTQKYRVDVYTQHEVTRISPKLHSVEVKNLLTGEISTDRYDKLVIATGAVPFIPKITGLAGDNHFVLRNVHHADAIRNFILEHQPETAVIIGTGFIALELCENLVRRGVRVTLLEIAGTVMPALDEDVSIQLGDHLESNNVGIRLGTAASEVSGVNGNIDIRTSSGENIHTQMFIIAAGIRPETSLAKNAGIPLGISGAIKVDDRMETGVKNIFACGDCAESFFILNAKQFYRPLGSTANKTGRIVGETLFDKSLRFRGILGTGIFQVFGLTVGQTGYTENQAKAEGLDYIVCHNIKPAKPEYMGGKSLFIKAIAEKGTGRMLGVQILGEEGADKRLDVFVTAMTFGAKAQDLFHLDLAYAPPFSTTKDPVMYTGMILENALFNGRGLMTPEELMKRDEEGENLQIIDARAKEQFDESHIDHAISASPDMLRELCPKLDPDAVTVTYCNKGVTGNAAQNILINRGFKKVYNLSGGHQNYKQIKKNKN